MPEHTLRAFADHGTIARTFDANPASAQRTIGAAPDGGIDLATLTSALEREGSARSVTLTISCWTASSANSPLQPPGDTRPSGGIRGRPLSAGHGGRRPGTPAAHNNPGRSGQPAGLAASLLKTARRGQARPLPLPSAARRAQISVHRRLQQGNMDQPA